jgi:hypothetical protein
MQQHGLHCTSRHKSVEGHGDGDGASRLLFLYAEQPYRHGVIHRAEAWVINQRGARVCLELEGEDGIRPDEDDPERQRLYISPNEARGMARYLFWMADVADGLTGDPNTRPVTGSPRTPRRSRCRHEGLRPAVPALAGRALAGRARRVRRAGGRLLAEAPQRVRGLPGLGRQEPERRVQVRPASTDCPRWDERPSAAEAARRRRGGALAPLGGEESVGRVWLARAKPAEPHLVNLRRQRPPLRGDGPAPNPVNRLDRDSKWRAPA